MSGTHAEDIKKEVRGYILVFVFLAFLTIVTVTIKYLHLGLVLGIIFALCIATIKASLVACYFMHLISEKQLIYGVLILTVFFFSAMMILFVTGHHDVQKGIQFVP